MKRTATRVLAMALCLVMAAGLLLTPAMAFENAAPAAYEAMFPVEDIAEQADYLMEEEEIVTALNGKRILFFGDSLLSGYGLDDYRQSWCSLLGSQYGVIGTNESVAASTFGTAASEKYEPGGSYKPISQRALPAGDFDVVFVSGGGNDWYCGIPLGTDLESRDTSNYTGALNTVIDRIRAAYPNALILFSTSWNSVGQANTVGLTTQDYSDTMLKVCQNRGVPCFKACDTAVSGINANDATFRSSYFVSATDYWHLNARGQKLYLPVIAQWMQDMLEEHYLSEAGFYDVYKHDWYADAVDYVAANGISNGTPGNTFSPDMVMQRGMLLTMLYRLAGSPDVTGLTHPFTDLKETEYYYSAVVWAYNQGIAKGTGGNIFAPEAELTREQLATFLFRYAGAENSDYTPGDLTVFTDAGEIGDYAETAMAWAVGVDILHGAGDGALAPLRSATRAEMAQLLTNYSRKFAA